MKTLHRRILLGIVFGVLVIAGLMIFADAEALMASLSGFDAVVLLPVLGVVSVGYALRVVKWQLYLRAVDVRLPWVESAWVFLAGLVMSITPAKVGEVLKSFLLKEARGVPITRTAPIVVAERLTDLLALVMLAAWGAALSGYGVTLVVVSSTLTLGLLTLLAWPRATHALLRIFGRLPLVGRFQTRLEEAYESMLTLIGWRILLVTTGLSILAWGGEGLCAAWIFDAFAISGGWEVAVFIFSFATLAGALSMLPGGLLATEASMIGLITGVFALTTSDEAATSATLLIRFCTLWFAVAVGCVALGVFRRHYLTRTSRPEMTPSETATLDGPPSQEADAESSFER